MAACRTVNVNMLWQQTLSQPLVTASWKDLKTCVTFWPNLGWCSTSLTRTEARTALMIQTFIMSQLQALMYTQVGTEDVVGQLHHLSRNVLPPRGSIEKWCSQGCFLLWHWKAVGTSPFHHCSWAPAISGQSLPASVMVLLCSPALPMALNSVTLSSSLGILQLCTNPALQQCASLLVQGCSWFEVCVKPLVLAQILVQLDGPIHVEWSRQGWASFGSALTSWIEANFSLGAIINLCWRSGIGSLPFAVSWNGSQFLKECWKS